MKILILACWANRAHLSEYLVNKNYEVIEFDIVNDQNKILLIPNKSLEESINSADFVYFLALT